MAALDSQPVNKNLLSPTGFRFILSRTPALNYFTYSVPIPSVTLGEIDIGNPLIRLPLPGDKLVYEPLSIRFRVDEDMTNYLEIHNWLVSLGHPQSLSQTAYRGPGNNTGVMNKGGDLYSDGTLLILTSNQNPNLQISFKRMFPTSLSELVFDAALTDIEYLEATVTFRYLLFTIQTI